MMKTIVYVDGFNLYYGAFKNTPYKWLNIHQLCCSLLSKSNEITQIKYFTARVSGRPNDPDQPTRQDTYLRALRTIPNLEIVFGSFLENAVSLPMACCLPYHLRFEKVVRTEEKGSDVNLAAHLVNDGHMGRYEVAVLVTNDSDLAEAVNIVRNELGLIVGILNPHRRQSKILAGAASFNKPIRTWALRECQFPEVLSDAMGNIRKPSSW